MSIHFAVVGLQHNHIYEICDQLLANSAVLDLVVENDDSLAAAFIAGYPQAARAETLEQILDNPAIRLVVCAAVPDERADIGVRVMRSGKDYIADKPGFASLEQLFQARQVQYETGRIYSVYYSERFGSRATLKAGELVRAGAIGQVIQTAGFGPHRLNAGQRPAWFFQRERSAGMLGDLASHQMDQFLYFTGSVSAEIVAAQVGNFHHPEYPDFDDFGDILVRSDRATGYCRVDWLSPDGLGTWGDARLLILGTEGSIELRKNVDLAGRPAGDHLFLVNQHGTQYIDCKDVPLTYGARMIQDIFNRTEITMPQRHCFLASELALIAEATATRIAPR